MISSPEHIFEEEAVELGQPQHRICEKNTDVPTILLEPLQPEGEPQVFIQWFGEAKDVSLEGMQFKFPAPVSPTLPHWLDGPTTFMVAYLGPAKDWPTKKAADEVVRALGQGDHERIVLWVASDVNQLHDGRGDRPRHRHTLDDFDEPCDECNRQRYVPNSFVIPMDILLGDPECGIIKPKMYMHRFFRRETWTGYERLKWLCEGRF